MKQQRWIGAVGIAALGMMTSWIKPEWALMIMLIGSGMIFPSHGGE